MHLILTHDEFAQDGVFGRLVTEIDDELAVTLEHVYLHPEGNVVSNKIPVGSYECVRGQHLLHGMPQSFTTFEVMGVPGHTGILFHWGNYNKDSDGCILLGQSIALQPNGERMITNSRATFEKFMELQAGVDSFQLTVK